MNDEDTNNIYSTVLKHRRFSICSLFKFSGQREFCSFHSTFRNVFGMILPNIFYCFIFYLEETKAAGIADIFSKEKGVSNSSILLKCTTFRMYHSLSNILLKQGTQYCAISKKFRFCQSNGSPGPYTFNGPVDGNVVRHIFLNSRKGRNNLNYLCI